MRWFSLSTMGLGLFAGAAFMPATARGQIFVVNNGNDTIGEYTTSGATINASLVSGLDDPLGIAVPGSDLFVVNGGNGTIGEYTTSGTTVNASLISGLNEPQGIAVSGSDLFIETHGDDSIGEYTTSGATVNASLISGLSKPIDVVVSGSDLFVGNSGPGTIGEYSTSGATVNASLISGLGADFGFVVSGLDLFVVDQDAGTIGEYTTSGATVNVSPVSGFNSSDRGGIVVSGSDLFVGNSGPGTIGEYTTSGATVNASLISGLNFPEGIALPTGAPPAISAPSTAQFASVPSGSIVDPLALDSKGDQPLDNSNGQLIFTITDGSVFTSITLPSTGTGTLDVSVDGIDLGQFQDGQQVVFADFASELGGLLINDPGIESFEISGLNGLTNFPLELNFDNSSADFTVATSVPEQATISLLGVATAALLRRRRPARLLFA